MMHIVLTYILSSLFISIALVVTWYSFLKRKTAFDNVQK